MEDQLNFILNKITSTEVLISWIIFSLGFLILKRSTSQKVQEQDERAIIGFIFEVMGYALVFSIRRDFFTDFIPMSNLIDILFTLIISYLAATSVWISLAAVKNLGRQWDLRARIIEGHELITSGPYRFVRHPIYSGMFGLLIITGYTISKPWAVMAAMVFYFIGTVLRTKVEERLLIQHFGDEYKEYKKRVPAIIPFIY